VPEPRPAPAPGTSDGHHTSSLSTQKVELIQKGCNRYQGSEAGLCSEVASRRPRVSGLPSVFGSRPRAPRHAATRDGQSTERERAVRAAGHARFARVDDLLDVSRATTVQIDLPARPA